jgi:CheY-like chemotaxis protein
MEKKFKNILLIDDDSSSNFFHKRLLTKKTNFAENVMAAVDGKEGIELLKSVKENGGQTPDVIFLDINMPVMDGWEFLEEYEKLEPEFKAKTVVIMLTSSLNPDDRDKALSYEDVDAMYNKLLDKDILADIEEKLL